MYASVYTCGTRKSVVKDQVKIRQYSGIALAYELSEYFLTDNSVMCLTWTWCASLGVWSCANLWCSVRETTM